MGDTLPQNPEPQQNLLEELLAGAAQKAAKEEADKLAAKGVVTRDDFNTALGAFKEGLLTEVKNVVADAVQKAQPAPVPEEDDEPVRKGAGRKGTIPAASDSTDPREANPVGYIVRKSRTVEQNPHGFEVPGYKKFDPTDKAIAWAVTLKGLTQGMSMEPVEGDEGNIDLSSLGL